MSFEAEFKKFMPQTLTVEPFSSYSTDGLGTRTYSSSLTFKCRIEERPRVVRGVDGRERVASATVYCSPVTVSSSGGYPIKPDDRVTLPSGFLVTGSSQPPVLYVERQQDASTDHHQVVYL